MNNGIIYIMTTAVSGLIKIGKTGSENYKERMRNLESNGYYNVSGLKKLFAIEVNDYDGKESLLHEIFVKNQVGSSELFALDYQIVQQLLLSFDGRVVYPEEINKMEVFEEISESQRQGNKFSFYKKGLKDGDIITFTEDKDIIAKVCGEREVEYESQRIKLSPLTYKIFEEKGKLTKSGAYQGAAYFEYKGTKLKNLPDIN
jgi:T5orf172 domain